MTITLPIRAACAASIVPALLCGTGPSFAATPKAAAAKPPVLTCTVTTPEGLSYTIIKPGMGEKPGTDSKVKVNYKGMLVSDGSTFDSGNGIEFKVGGVIVGFAQGLQLMQPGGSYRLCIPSKLGYGETGTGPIPGNADLVFEVDMLSFTNPPPKPVIPVAERTCDQITASGLGYRVIKTGTGRTPVDGDVTLVDFITFDANTGVTMEKREWEKIALAQVTPMFGEALKLMAAGSNYTVCIPPPKADDAAAPQPQINIRVDLLDVRPAPVAD
jgi:FKBP-type peptidyl-prolyl cis-trans isomerase